MDLNKILKLTDKEIQLIVFLEKYAKGRWTINKKTGLVDIEGDFNCSKKYLKDFKGARFGVVTGGFYCDNNSLTSLVGAPQEVGWSFFCHHNKLTSLVGAPREVGGSFDCSYNKLTSLEGAPQEVGGDFYCSNNRLTSLVGAPQKLGGDFFCHHNKLTSLVGAPQEVGVSFDCSYNKISEKTLKLVWETMQKNNMDYWTALCVVKSEIDSKEWSELSKGIDDSLDKDSQKGISMMGRFGHFD